MKKMSKLLELERKGCPEVTAKDEANKAEEKLFSGKEDFTGWTSLAGQKGSEEYGRIKIAAKKIRNICDSFVIIGIGGSYLGARAAIEMLGLMHGENGGPEIIFAGQNISGTYHAELLKNLKDKDICLCVISKSGTTAEPNIAFSVLKGLMESKYGENYSDRVFAITDKSRGTLREEANRMGYETFVIPDDVGGRYSVLTPVGLLPMAVSGVDIDEVLDGANRASEADVLAISKEYAGLRKALLDGGKKIEVIESYEPRLFYFTEWLKQLFGESEGKDGKGLFPAGLTFSTDLHSMGQFLQDGSQIFFETILNVREMPEDVQVPESADKLLAGKSMNEINAAAMYGVIAAHEMAGVPIVKIDIPDISAYSFGQMVFFFETACAITAYLMGVNPFNQPGVEQYKTEMRRLLSEK